MAFEDIGEHTFEDGSVWPAARLTVTARDPDDDLDSYRLEVWWDDEVDGAVDTTEDPFASEATLSDGGVCVVRDATVDMTVAITGAPPGGTEVEWQVVIYDAGGVASEPWIDSWVTPSR